MNADRIELCQRILNTCASINLRRFSRLVTNEYNEALRPIGLRTTQLAVLVAIGAADKQSLTDIADALSMDISTLTRAVAILEEKGLALSQAAGGRKKHVLLTSEGYHTVATAFGYWQKAQNTFDERISKELYDMICTVAYTYLKRKQAA